MHPAHSIRIASAAALLMGCASTQSKPASARQQAAVGQLGPAFLEWDGKFRPSEQQTGAITVHAHNAVAGDVRLTAVDENMLRAQINFSIDMSPAINDNYRWSLSSGDCRSNTIPLLPVSEFPPMPVTNNRGSIDASVNLPLPTSGRYHVNIFWSTGADEGDVIACAPLSLNQKSQGH